MACSKHQLVLHLLLVVELLLQLEIDLKILPKYLIEKSIKLVAYPYQLKIQINRIICQAHRMR
jgi:hypothetical protein